MPRYGSITKEDATLNTVQGCRKIDIGPLGACENFYIFRPWFNRMKTRRTGRDMNFVDYRKSENVLRELRPWTKDPTLKRIFLNDMGDTFHEDIPFETIETWHKEIIEAFPNFQFRLCTKRIGRAVVFYRERGSVPENVWMGTTVAAKKTLRRLDQLRQIPARIRWVSFEPLLEDLGDFSLRGIHWAVVGGESDDENPRPMKPEWAVGISDVCKRDRVRYFFKQMGGKGRQGAGGNICPCCNKVHQQIPE